MALLTLCGQEREPTTSRQTTYFVAVVTKGKNWTAEQSPELTRQQQEHGEWVRKMISEGKILLSGPFTDDGEIRGLYIFRVA